MFQKTVTIFIFLKCYKNLDHFTRNINIKSETFKRCYLCLYIECVSVDIIHTPSGKTLNIAPNILISFLKQPKSIFPLINFPESV